MEYPTTSISGKFAGNILTLKPFSIKLTTILVGKPLYFPATCLKYNNFIGGIPLQLDGKWS